jgi:hypothetical protein
VDAIPFPATRPFEVWFVPSEGAALRLETPLRIGAPHATFEIARQYAERAVRDLPAYGFAAGRVLVIWNGTSVQVLHTVSVQAAGDGRCALAVIGPPQRDLIRVVLEDLGHLTTQAESAQAAPPAWIARFHEVLHLVSDPEVAQRYRLDGLFCVTVEDLRRRVHSVLRREEQPAPAVTQSPVAVGAQPFAG